MKKIIAMILSVILVMSLFAGCGAKKSDSDLAYVKDKGKLIVGITDYAPMDYKDENGNWTGFDAEFAQLVAKELGVEVEFFVIADWSKKVFELDSMNIDCIWNGMTINEASINKCHWLGFQGPLLVALFSAYPPLPNVLLWSNNFIF